MYVSMKPEDQKNHTRKIELIKALRELTGVGLKDGKGIVERLMAGEVLDIGEYSVEVAKKLFSQFGVQIDETPLTNAEIKSAKNFTLRKTLDAVNAGNFSDATNWYQMVNIIEELNRKINGLDIQ